MNSTSLHPLSSSTSVLNHSANLHCFPTTCHYPITNLASIHVLITSPRPSSPSFIHTNTKECLQMKLDNVKERIEKLEKCFPVTTIQKITMECGKTTGLHQLYCTSFMLTSGKRFESALMDVLSGMCAIHPASASSGNKSKPSRLIIVPVPNVNQCNLLSPTRPQHRFLCVYRVCISYRGNNKLIGGYHKLCRNPFMRIRN